MVRAGGDFGHSGVGRKQDLPQTATTLVREVAVVVFPLPSWPWSFRPHATAPPVAVRAPHVRHCGSRPRPRRSPRIGAGPGEPVHVGLHHRRLSGRGVLAGATHPQAGRANVWDPDRPSRPRPDARCARRTYSTLLPPTMTDCGTERVATYGSDLVACRPPPLVSCGSWIPRYGLEFGAGS